MTTSEHYISAGWEDFFPAAGRFEFLWQLAAEQVDKPNRSGSGWSAVLRAVLVNSDGERRECYIKRQQDYLLRSVLRPLGELSVSCEFRKLQLFTEFGVPTLTPVFFAESNDGGHRRGILVTESLENFTPLRRVLAKDLPEVRRRTNLARAVGSTVRLMHDAGLEHRNLYPKHLMVRESSNGDWDVRIIDLEAARYHKWWRGYRYRDLESLDRRSTGWSRSQKLAALLAYFNTASTNNEARACLKFFKRRRG